MDWTGTRRSKYMNLCWIDNIHEEPNPPALILGFHVTGHKSKPINGFVNIRRISLHLAPSTCFADLGHVEAWQFFLWFALVHISVVSHVFCVLNKLDLLNILLVLPKKYCHYLLNDFKKSKTLDYLDWRGKVWIPFCKDFQKVVTRYGPWRNQLVFLRRCGTQVVFRWTETLVECLWKPSLPSLTSYSFQKTWKR